MCAIVLLRPTAADASCRLSEAIHILLTLTMIPSVPQSLLHVPTNYVLVARLWKTAFCHLLETLRRAASSYPPEAEENVALKYPAVSAVFDKPWAVTEPYICRLLSTMHMPSVLAYSTSQTLPNSAVTG